MYSSIEIHGYRRFESFRLAGLGRVNLLVGTNNCGKTSILECIELLRSAGRPLVLQSILGRRGEWQDANDSVRPALDVKRLFANHDLGGKIVVGGCSAESLDVQDQVVMEVQEAASSIEQEELPGLFEDESSLDEELFLNVNWSNPAEAFRTRITGDGLLDSRLLRTRNGHGQTVVFIRTPGMTSRDVVRLFGDIVLTEREDHITRALRVLEPAIERLAPVPYDRGPIVREGPGGVFLRLKGVADRIPIGSVGDGMWRMLGLALGLANAKDGILLVDEIDTGLHYSVMEDMWRVVRERACALSIQVFATTHSRDCFESLAAIAKSDVESGDVTIQRVDAGRDDAVRFGNQEIVAAADRSLEVR
ncbi:MAG: AAA family ATPase [Gammaproteobacteria bacterium]|nr:AAA family ATPase [Gammaproteobacteria bacterium]MDE0443866.1 AAA family ATPase [Gammaproteobacteria bacterium]